HTHRPHNTTHTSPTRRASELKVTDHAANQYVGGKMLMAADARNVHQRRKTVNHYFGERSWILVRDDSGHGPRRSGVFGRKGRATDRKSTSELQSRVDLVCRLL